MGYIEDVLIEARTASVKAADAADKASQTGDPAAQFTLILVGIDETVRSLELLREARRKLVGGMSSD